MHASCISAAAVFQPAGRRTIPVREANQSDPNLQRKRGLLLPTAAFLHRIFYPGTSRSSARGSANTCPGEETPWELVHAVGHPGGKQLGRERPGELSMCACSKDNEMNPGLH